MNIRSVTCFLNAGDPETQAAEIREAGYAVVDPYALAAAPEEIALRALSRLIAVQSE